MNITKIIVCAVSFASVGFAVEYDYTENRSVGNASLESANLEHTKRKRVLADVTNLVVEGKRKRNPNPRFAQYDRIDGKPESSNKSVKSVRDIAIEAVTATEVVTFPVISAVLTASRSADYMSDDASRDSLVYSSPSSDSNASGASYYDSSPFNQALKDWDLGQINFTNCGFLDGSSPVAVQSSPSIYGSVPPQSEAKSIDTSFTWTKSPSRIPTGTRSSETPMSQSFGEHLLWTNSSRSSLAGFTPMSPGTFGRLLVDFYGQ